MGYVTDTSTEDWLSSVSQTIRGTGFHVNEEGELCKLEKGELKPLCNFIFRPVEKIKRVDNQGIAKEYKYVFEGGLKREQKLDRVEILISDLENHKWIKKNWDVFCKVYSNERHNYSSIQDYIYLSARNIPEKIEYDTIGWHYFDKNWFFLHSEGIIGSIERNIGTTNTEFVFKRNLSLTPKDAFLESLNMLDICDHKLSYSLLSYLLTSIITTPLLASNELAPNYLLWIVGQTGYGKTTFSTFFTSIYEKTNLARPDAHKTKTIMPGIKEHKDCVFVIDDFGTSKTKQNEYSVINKIEDIIRNMTDRQLSSLNISDGMVLITGEKFLDTHNRNESSKKRIIRAKMDNLFNREDTQTYDAAKSKLFMKYKDERHLPTSITYYLEWLCEQLNSAFIDEYKKDFEALRTELGEKYGSHGRYTDSFTHQIIAFNFYMSYGKERGFITPEDFVNKCKKAKQIFGELLEDQNKTIFDPQVELFLQSLRELISTEEIRVELNGRSLNFDKKVFGVVTTEKGQEVLKLDWETIYRQAVDSIEKSQGSHKLIGNKLLAKLLDEYNLICFNENGTTTQFWNISTRTLIKERCRVINFRTNMIPDIMEVIKKLNKKSQTEGFSLTLSGASNKSKQRKKRDW
ncbi:hypothetical protein K0T92_18290 [Paenibacillus oenotherae]|uniref:DUF927 domain-containing protein n=1 Tax=Paenibacillus oenotherae TaxID=1435645 RepID=A0ABS7D9W9_9BACL|nr:hypothetical protein [Paenibacillus oenotherae]MBW7476671.1 hypothetical protein [Paenibacillus oenotherae]